MFVYVVSCWTRCYLFSVIKGTLHYYENINNKSNSSNPSSESIHREKTVYYGYRSTTCLISASMRTTDCDAFGVLELMHPTVVVPFSVNPRLELGDGNELDVSVTYLW
jgi:hypothetical protein